MSRGVYFSGGLSERGMIGALYLRDCYAGFASCYRDQRSFVNCR